ncbi:MAG: HAD-IC family P-type ATPase [Rhodoluna sp.]|nr:HAD-IC family P-type ATPase [Rhodoluna sp.]
MRKHNGYSTMNKVGVFATLAFTLLVLVVSPNVFGVTISSDFDQWVLLGVGLAVASVGCLRVWVSAFGELRDRAPGQHVLSLLGLLVLSGFAVWQSFTNWRTDVWWQVASVASVLVVCDWFLSSMVARVAGLSPDLISLLPEFADVIVDNEITRVRASELEIGDIVLVRPSSVVPADGVVVQGSSSVDESALTGEAIAVDKGEGSHVFAGTLNASAKKSNKALTIRVTAVGGDLLVHSFTRRVAELAQERGTVDTLSARLTSGLFVLTVAAAFIGAGLWLVIEPDHWANGVFTASAVLLAANIALVGKASGLVSVMLAAVAGSQGVLVKARTALYRIRKSHVVVLNLVGTLTSGKPKLVEIHLAKGTSLGSVNEVLAVAAAADVNSDHSLARVILAEAAARRVEAVSLYEIEPHPMGVSARMDGSSVLVGNAGILTSNGVPIDVQDLVKVSAANERGNSVVYVVIDNLLVGYLEFSDDIRETARDAINKLHLQRKRIVAITGEATGVAEAVCKSLGITEFFAEVVQERKLAIIDQLRQDGSIITVVGDPFADAELLASADVGIAIGVGGELGSESADLLVISNEPRAVARIMRLAKRATRTLNLSLVFVTLFDVLAIGFAGFYPLPLASAGLVLVSTILSSSAIWRLRK